MTTTPAYPYDSVTAAEDPNWFTEGFVVAARAERSDTIHAGVVHPLNDTTYSMGPLCARYRKRDGTRLKRHEDQGIPMLVRSLRRAFANFVDSSPWPICTHCRDVWTADQERRRATPPCPECTGPPYACQNCRRPIEWLDGIGWLHAELPRYAHEPITCTRPVPVHQQQGSQHPEGADQ